jgi:competence protein ComFC
MSLSAPGEDPINRVADFFETLLGFFYPHICQICAEGVATAREGFVCADCWSGPRGVHFIVPPFCEKCGLPFEGSITTEFTCGNCRDQTLHFRRARAAVKLGDVVQETVHKFKYNKALWFEAFLSDLLLRQALQEIRKERWDFIVPIPLHWRKRWQRGFNQADRLALQLSKATQTPVNRKLLKRVEPTPTQTRLSRKERIENVRRAFRFKAKEKLHGERILVVDDVLTTGATASACAKVLRDNGAGDVDVWTVARGGLQ